MTIRGMPWHRNKRRPGLSGCAHVPPDPHRRSPSQHRRLRPAPADSAGAGGGGRLPARPARRRQPRRTRPPGAARPPRARVRTGGAPRALTRGARLRSWAARARSGRRPAHPPPAGTSGAAGVGVCPALPPRGCPAPGGRRRRPHAALADRGRPRAAGPGRGERGRAGGGAAPSGRAARLRPAAGRPRHSLASGPLSPPRFPCRRPPLGLFELAP